MSDTHDLLRQGQEAARLSLRDTLLAEQAAVWARKGSHTFAAPVYDSQRLRAVKKIPGYTLVGGFEMSTVTFDYSGEGDSAIPRTELNYLLQSTGRSPLPHIAPESGIDDVPLYPQDTLVVIGSTELERISALNSSREGVRGAVEVLGEMFERAEIGMGLKVLYPGDESRYSVRGTDLFKISVDTQGNVTADDYAGITHLLVTPSAAPEGSAR